MDGTEIIKKDFSHLSEKEAIAHLTKESPEFMDLLDDFKLKLNEVTTKIGPLVTKLKSMNIPTSKGMSLLELKNQLLLNYCLNLSFYFYLKASGSITSASIQQHPVIAQLVELRLFMEKLKPIETKLRYQIDKLVKMAETSTGNIFSYIIDINSN